MIHRTCWVAAISMILTIGRPGPAGSGQEPSPVPGAEGVLHIDGSNGLLPLAAALQTAMRQQGADLQITLGAGLGAKARLDALASGAIHIALASHGLDLDELVKRGMTAHRVAVTPVVFGVHPAVSVLDLKPKDICDIYSGKVSNWASFGGPAIAIKPFLRAESDVDTEVVRGLIPCMKDLVSGPSVSVARSTSLMLAELQNTPGAIGLTTTTAVQRSPVPVRALSFASVPPTPANVHNGTYPLVRPAYLVTMSQPPAAARRFVDFVRSDRGSAAILEAGALPVK